ncbi:MAG TPA: M20/M25/M40 family metallo-hydrolase [Gemmatimonadales bacterium]|nr:M20/M25/M40 family metallo-hydrolase [Gemmatimonadales bacterium]
MHRVFAGSIALLLTLSLPAQAQRSPGRPAPRIVDSATAASASSLLEALAHDSLEGRDTGTRGAAAAARIIAAALQRAGVQPAGDSGFFQRVPLARQNIALRDGSIRRVLRLQPNFAARDTFPAADRVDAVNVVGMIPGSDPALREEAVVITAHYDHVGIGRAVNGDSIYNGADDDASGTVAVLEIARILAQGPAPRRTMIFLLVTGEEHGLLGTRWYIEHPVVPLARTVANLNIEMIARPDSLAGGAGRGWLTGFDRSTMGQLLREAGVSLVSDPRPEHHFFERSDNIAFARRGIPAHTISSYNMHNDYHQPSDETRFADPAHMARVINASARAARVLADGPAPAWAPGDPFGQIPR